jgi:putative methylase
MFKISKKKHLEIAIQSIPRHPKPKVKLEQYSTPATITADVLWNAHNLGDVFNKKTLDLGCGTGILAISSLLLGAKEAIGIDIDSDSIDVAKETAREMSIHNSNFFTKDIHFLKDKLLFRDKLLKKEEYHDSNSLEKQTESLSKNNDLNESFRNIDTVFQNPPFGSQFRSKKGIDRIFMEVAISLAPVIYSFHMAETEEFVSNYFSNLGGKVTHKFFYEFQLDNIYDFHKSESKNIKVIVVRVEK